MQSGQDPSWINRPLLQIEISWLEEAALLRWCFGLDVHVKDWVFAGSRRVALLLLLLTPALREPPGPSHCCGF